MVWKSFYKKTNAHTHIFQKGRLSRTKGVRESREELQRFSCRGRSSTRSRGACRDFQQAKRGRRPMPKTKKHTPDTRNSTWRRLERRLNVHRRAVSKPLQCAFASYGVFICIVSVLGRLPTYMYLDDFLAPPTQGATGAVCRLPPTKAFRALGWPWRAQLYGCWPSAARSGLLCED